MKIVKVIRAIINNPQNISDILRDKAEIFFEYRGKYKWSISKTEEGEYYLHLYYKGDMNLQELSDFTDWENYSYDSFTSTELEAFGDGIMEELYTILDHKDSGVDDIFDDIISDDMFN